MRTALHTQALQEGYADLDAIALFSQVQVYKAASAEHIHPPVGANPAVATRLGRTGGTSATGDQSCGGGSARRRARGSRQDFRAKGRPAARRAAGFYGNKGSFVTNLNEQGRFLGNRLMAQLCTLVDGNHVRAAEMQEQALRCADCFVEIGVDWGFEARTELRTLAGDAAVADAHCGYDMAAFNRLTDSRSKQASDDHDLRDRFNQRLKNEQQDALLWAAQPQLAWDFGQHSVCNHCQPCRGSGQVSCHGCSGQGALSCSRCSGSGSTTGTRTVNTHGNRTRQETYSQSCNGCFGSGRVRCNSCGGDGVLRCNSCSGHGFFTDLMHVTAVATARVEVHTSSTLSAKPLRDYLARMGCAHAAQNFSFEARSARTTPRDTLQVTFECTTVLLELDFSLRGISYMAAAAGERPLAFIRPPIFDLIFREELQALQKLTHARAGLRLNKSKAVAFFKAYRGQPVLDSALQSVAKIAYHERGTEKAGQTVMAACEDYISRAASQSLGQCMADMVDKVSPAYSPMVWCAASIVCAIVAFFIGESGLERTQSTSWALFLPFILSILYAVILMTMVSPFAWLLSATVSFSRRQFIPAEYRQQPRNWQPLGSAILACTVAATLGAGYGWLASIGGFPALGEAPQRWLSARGVVSASQNYALSNWTRALWPYPRNQLLKVPTPSLTQSEMIRAIQLELRRKERPHLLADGQMGPETIALVAAYRKKYHLPKIADLPQVLAHMQSRNTD